MSGSEELILGFCPLPFEDEVIEDGMIEDLDDSQPNTPFFENEIITGDIGDFPITFDEIENEEETLSSPGDEPINCESDETLSRKMVPECDDSSVTLTASESGSVDELPSSDSTRNVISNIKCSAFGESISGSRDTVKEWNVSHTLGIKQFPQSNSDGNVLHTVTYAKTQETKKSFGCPNCGQEFTRKCNLDFHLKRNCGPSKHSNSNSNVACPLCDRSFRYSSQLREHIILGHNNTPPFSCPICTRSIALWKRTVERHMSSHASKRECPTCTQKFNSYEILDLHIQNESKARGHLLCFGCNAPYTNRVDYFAHVNEHIPGNVHLELMTCTGCNLKFRFTKDFVNHVKKICKKAKLADSDIECINIDDVGDSGNDDEDEEDDELLPASDDICERAVQSPTVPMNTVVYIPQLVLMPTTVSMVPNEDSSMSPSLVPNTTHSFMPGLVPIERHNVSDSGMNAGAQQVSDEMVLVECIKEELDTTTNDAASDPNLNTVEDEGDGTPQLCLGNVYSLAGSKSPSQEQTATVQQRVGLLSKCPSCSQWFTDSSSLEQHVTIHTKKDEDQRHITKILKGEDLPRYQCPRCYRFFKYSHSVEMHLEGKRCRPKKTAFSAESVAKNFCSAGTWRNT